MSKSAISLKYPRMAIDRKRGIPVKHDARWHIHWNELKKIVSVRELTPPKKVEKILNYLFKQNDNDKFFALEALLVLCDYTARLDVDYLAHIPEKVMDAIKEKVSEIRFMTETNIFVWRVFKLIFKKIRISDKRDEIDYFSYDEKIDILMLLLYGPPSTRLAVSRQESFWLRYFS